jgi:hypothetical protein
MHKLNTITLHVWLFLMLSMQSVSLHSMLSVSNNDNFLWEVIAHNLSHGNYEAHRTFARINVGCNKAIEDNYRSDKKRIELLELEEGTEVFWNKNFSRCAWVTFKQKPYYNFDNSKHLELTLIGLNKDRKIVIRRSLREGHIFSVIDNRICPFFDKKGDAFCYFNLYKDFLECSLNFDGTVKQKVNCVGTFGGDFSLYEVLNFPVLLKAILRSKKIYEYGISRNIYHIDGVTVPEDYKFFKKYSCCENYLSYDQLPNVLRQAIDEQYEEQQREKHNGKVVGK